MIYQLLPESPKSGQIDRCRFGSKAYLMAIASVVFYVVFFVLTGEAGDASRDGTISGLNGSIAKDVSSGFVVHEIAPFLPGAILHQVAGVGIFRN
jgi:hypothetical protein